MRLNATSYLYIHSLQQSVYVFLYVQIHSYMSRQCNDLLGHSK